MSAWAWAGGETKRGNLELWISDTENWEPGPRMMETAHNHHRSQLASVSQWMCPDCGDIFIIMTGWIGWRMKVRRAVYTVHPWECGGQVWSIRCLCWHLVTSPPLLPHIVTLPVTTRLVTGAVVGNVIHWQRENKLYELIDHYVNGDHNNLVFWPIVVQSSVKLDARAQAQCKLNYSRICRNNKCCSITIFACTYCGHVQLVCSCRLWTT